MTLLRVISSRFLCYRKITKRHSVILSGGTAAAKRLKECVTFKLSTQFGFEFEQIWKHGN
jgi:hypothetical protein